MRRRCLPLPAPLFLLPCLSLLITACQTADYGASVTSADPDFSTLESRIEQYRDVQQEALQQFQAAGQLLARWSSPGQADLQALYTDTVQQDRAAIQAAAEVAPALNSVEAAAESVFKEWQLAVDRYTDTQVKAEDQKRLGGSWQRYADMLQVLRQCEAKMRSVLAALHSNEEYFKDNLSATSIANRQPQLNALRNEVQTLEYRMNIALDSTEAFINSID